MLANAVFLRYVVVGDAIFRQHDADPDVFAVLIGRTALLDDIASKAGALIDAQDSGDATDHAADDTADHCADGACGAFTIASASFDPARNPLGLGQ
jgi:hypothetical protein